MTDRERFFSKVIPEPNSGCWIWDGFVRKDGYGDFWLRNDTKRAHRCSWEIYRGVIPAGKCVLHRCDNPSCVNPDHLFLGTHKDNTQDMIKKGRKYSKVGKNHHLARLTEDAVRDIRTRRISYSQFARLYGVSIGCISNVAQGINWSHVKEG